MTPSPWISVLISIAAFLLSAIVAAENFYRRTRDRRDAAPCFTVQAKPWYEQCGSGMILSSVEFVAVNVSTSPTNVAEAGIEVLNAAGHVSMLSYVRDIEKKKLPCVVEPHEPLRWTTSADRIFDLVEDDPGFAKDGTRVRGYVGAIGRAGLQAWRSETVLVSASDVPPWRGFSGPFGDQADND